MAKTYVLDRVAADLARGFTHPAIQRLSSLVAAYPNDLDLRRRLAAVHRRVGNRIQAGRWDYLTIGADTHDTHAFERAFPSAATRLREVKWPHRAGAAATAYARNRLAKLVAAAEAERPAAVPTDAAPAANRTAGSNGSAGSGAPRRAAEGWSGSLVALLAQWRPFGRSWRFTSISLAVAALAAATLVVVGLVTVVQWIVQ
jgi:hypothetical protein